MIATYKITALWYVHIYRHILSAHPCCAFPAEGGGWPLGSSLRLAQPRGLGVRASAGKVEWLLRIKDRSSRLGGLSCRPGGQNLQASTPCDSAALEVELADR